ncbi:unnamed protein product [Clonostachys rosea f. rosea IK726]|uniref:Uncharacterized protein n=1 Tax=Clonostachys rosea f. rosea IK726 TaxID=1349383 RepID=A0ACA9UAV9_BIOOC|nr:unnamed protein product [Clonostachys rosea f. rosea IK726]
MVRPLIQGFDGEYYQSFGKHANCTLEVCPIEATIYKYNPSKPVNTALAVIFGLIMVGHIYLGVRWKTWGYMVSMILGCLFEIAGYACRIVLHKNPFKFIPFVVQTVALTIAPIFYTAGIYVTLSASISHFAPAPVQEAQEVGKHDGGHNILVELPHEVPLGLMINHHVVRSVGG